jgi:hypothetical protein
MIYSECWGRPGPGGGAAATLPTVTTVTYYSLPASESVTLRSLSQPLPFGPPLPPPSPLPADTSSVTTQAGIIMEGHKQQLASDQLRVGAQYQLERLTKDSATHGPCASASTEEKYRGSVSESDSEVGEHYCQ